jgi:hypothetical protein
LRLPYGKSSRAYLFEVVQVPFMVLTRPMSWQIIRLLVAHDLGADLELLLWKSVYIQLQNLNRMRTFLCASSTSVGVLGGEHRPRTFLTEGAPRPHRARASKRRAKLVPSSMCGKLPPTPRPHSPLIAASHAHTGKKSATPTPCLPNLRDWPATPPSGCV